MKKIVLSILALISSLPVFCQEPVLNPLYIPKNSVNLNLLGRGSSVALTYERLLPISPFFIMAVDFGAGYGKEIQLVPDTTGKNKPPVYLTIPHQLTINIGKGRSFIEAGIGGTATIGNVFPHYMWYPIAGFRFQPLKSGNMKVRVYGNFLTVNTDDFRNIFFTPFGLSIGYCF